MKWGLMDLVVLILQSVKSGLPFLISHFLISILIFLIGLWVYTKITPLNEMDLIKKGNIAAAISFVSETPDVAVYMEASHFCVKSRGIQDVGSSTCTLAVEKE